MRKIITLFLCVFAVSAGMVMALPLDAETTIHSDHKKVLILNSYHKGYPWSDEELEGLERTIHDQYPLAQLFIEYMDTKVHGPGYVFPDLIKLYALKYADEQFDAIVTVDNNAYDFVRANRELLFADVPVIFCGINAPETEAASYALPGMTGIFEGTNHKGTILFMEQAFSLTTDIVIISDTTRTGQLDLASVRAVIDSLELNMNVHEFVGVPLDDISHKLEKLPKTTVVIYLYSFIDVEGRKYTIRESVDALRVLSVPVFVYHSFYVREGLFGGIVIDADYHASLAGGLVNQVLSGEDPDALPVIVSTKRVPMANKAQCLKFHVPRTRLPQGTFIVGDQEEEAISFLWLAMIILLSACMGGIVTMTIRAIVSRSKRGVVPQRDASSNVKNDSFSTGKLQRTESQLLRALLYAQSENVKKHIEIIKNAQYVLGNVISGENNIQATKHVGLIKSHVSEMTSSLEMMYQALYVDDKRTVSLFVMYDDLLMRMRQQFPAIPISLQKETDIVEVSANQQQLEIFARGIIEALLDCNGNVTRIDMLIARKHEFISIGIAGVFDFPLEGIMRKEIEDDARILLADAIMRLYKGSLWITNEKNILTIKGRLPILY